MLPKTELQEKRLQKKLKTLPTASQPPFLPETGTLLSLRDISPNRGISLKGTAVQSAKCKIAFEVSQMIQRHPADLGGMFSFAF